jgi:DNA-binding response OmpR family regulator
MKILVADDSPTCRHTVAAQLRADGYEVLEAADGEEALKLARSGSIDLLVLERAMPKLDGFGVISALAEDPQARTLPVVMVSEQPTEDDVLRGLNLGVRDFIAKPFSLRELSERVRRVMLRNTPPP